MTQHPTEATTPGILTTLGSTIGLALGPSVLAVLTISPYIVPIQEEFGWTRVQVSLAFTIVAYMIVLVSPLQGVLVDRLGPRRVVLGSIPLFAASLAALYFTPKTFSCTTCYGPLCQSLRSDCGHSVICRP
jgi:MFS family permease